MRFVCLVYIDPKMAFNGEPANDAVLGEAEAYRQELLGKGIPSEALDLPKGAVTVRVRKGRMSRTDGPFMETKEMLAGFVLIEADSLEAAVGMAAINPVAKLGAVEIRPVVDFSRPRPIL